MKNTIITSDTIKVIDEPFSKNSKGKYSTKNTLLLDYAKKCLSLKLGESILINFVHGKVKIGKTSSDNIEYNTNSDLLKVNELVNFLIIYQYVLPIEFLELLIMITGNS